jgi:hypothetical protein
LEEFKGDVEGRSLALTLNMTLDLNRQLASDGRKELESVAGATLTLNLVSMWAELKSKSSSSQSATAAAAAP